MKRQMKAKLKAKEAAAKQQATADSNAEAAAENNSGKKQAVVDSSDPAEYFRSRVAALEARRAAGDNPFPHKFDVTTSLADFIDAYDSTLTEKGKVLEQQSVRVAGLYK